MSADELATAAPWLTPHALAEGAYLLTTAESLLGAIPGPVLDLLRDLLWSDSPAAATVLRHLREWAGVPEVAR